MLLSEYQDEIVGVIGRYAHTDLIVSSELTVDARTPKTGIVKGTLTFADGAQLFFMEFIDARYRVEKLTYSYHFQDEKARLLFRYDNAAHKPSLPFACHKHLPTGEIIEAAAPDLGAVLVEALQHLVR